MTNIFDLASVCLHHSDIEKKLETTELAAHLLSQQSLSFADNTPPENIDQVQFPEQPQLLAPKFMPKRNATTATGIIATFHALAHIEFIAIYLAWDIVYRFRGLPEQFYKDWLHVAHEEAQHFELIHTHLQALGCHYGDLPAHQGLWNHAQDTANDILARLALVPRCMEARGLDATPAIIQKFKSQHDEKSVAILERILNDEIGHVALGSYWFKTLCEQQGFEPEQKYQQLLQQHYHGKLRGPFNKEMRIIAGFSTAEINWLKNQ